MNLGKMCLSEVVQAAVDAGVAEVRVSLPGTIEHFDPQTQLASVRPDLSEIHTEEDGTETVSVLDVVSDVPVQFVGGGGHSATFPVAQGDPCLLIFTDRSLEEWISNGGRVDPADLRRHHLSDAVALLGVRSKPGAIRGFDTTHTTLGQDGAAADFVALATKVHDALHVLKTAISDAAVSPGDGGATFKTNLIAALSSWPPDVGSATVKIKG